MRDRGRAKSKFSAAWAILAVLAVLAFVAFVRLRIADAPLERDEGEYAYAGRLILEGIPPYSIAYNMKFPGTYYAYAAILAILGRTTTAIHVGLMLVNAASIVLVFAVGRRLLGAFAGAAAAVAFGILSVDRWVYGGAAHATHFVVLAAMAGVLALLRALENERASWFLGSGVLLGISVLMKQHAVFFLPLAAVMVFASESGGEGSAARAKAKRLGILALGAVIPPVAVVLGLLAQGVLGRFWFWTFRYASAYVSEIPVSKAWSMLAEGFKSAAQANLAFWALGALGLAALWIGRWDRRARFVLTGLLLASFLAVCPGFYFRGHYFILVLPAVALLCGAAVASLRRYLERTVSPAVATAAAVAVLAVATGAYVTKEAAYLFSMSTRTLSRTVYMANPFIEAVEIGRYLRERTNENDRIAVMGSEPEIYFYADRKAATGYIYTYALMERQPFARSMQEEMIREIESAHPLYLVFSWVSTSWLARDDSDQRVVTWARQYVRQCYDPVGVADIFSPEESRIVWGDTVKDYVGRSPNLVYTFRRKSEAPCAVGN